MSKRLTGIVIEREVQETHVDVVGLGLKAFSLRAEIMALWADAQPIIDVIKLQLPKVISRGRELYARMMPEEQAMLAAQAPVATFDALWVQERLKKLGYDPGPLDGIHGQMSRAAVRKFQVEHDLLPDEWPGRETVIAIGVALAGS